MWDMAPGGSWPGTDATVVEGLGMGACSYSVSSVESATVTLLHDGHNTITEISPQNYCVTTISGYATDISDITSYVENHASNARTQWGGIMLDEETGYGFSASQLETLNSDVKSTMQSTPGISWYFTENAPGEWSVATYHALGVSSYLAPQIYNTNDANTANSSCDTYGGNDCTNAVTIDNNLAAPWNSISYVTGLIEGTPFVNGWHNYVDFCNIWVPV
jgi:hypothetical protein